jgi:AAT family amino acid transporter
MRGYPVLTLVGLAVLALIFVLLVATPATRMQFVSMVVLAGVIAALNKAVRSLRRARA